jgi:dephospho-CoA kinase
VLSTDSVVHELYDDPEVRDEVIARFGALVAPGGVVDRPAVARAAFASREDRAWLEGLLWPRVGARIARWREQLEPGPLAPGAGAPAPGAAPPPRAAPPLRAAPPPPRAAVVEVPLLFESGMGDVFDATIAVIADEDVRAERAGARGHAALAERGARQLTQQGKAQRATYVVVNDGTVAELEKKLSAILEKLAR